MGPQFSSRRRRAAADDAGPAREKLAYDEGRFALVAEAASKWRPELDEAISEMERFYAHNFARLLADHHDLDHQEIAATVHEFFRRLRADISEAAKARREVLQERGRSLPE